MSSCLFQCWRHCARKPLPFNLFADPHPLTPVVSILYENSGGRGVSTLRLRFRLKSFNRITYGDNQKADIWHWKSVRTGSVGQMDDQYLDATRYDKDKAPEAGRKSDPKTGGGYADNVGDDKKGPKFALKGNKPAPPYWIVDAEKEPFDDSKYKAGDEVPGIVVSPFTGDRGQISVKSAWKDGTWTLVFWRKLVTNSEFDVQFNERKEYAFGVAVFDNAQVRHAYTPGVLKLVIE